MSGRADPFADAEIDVSAFAMKPAARPKISAEAIREVSEQHRFPSRAAAHSPAPPAKQQRRHRTGRNQQLNLKVTPQAAERFLALADRRGWVLGEAFEKAIESLERELAAEEGGG